LEGEVGSLGGQGEAEGEEEDREWAEHLLSVVWWGRRLGGLKSAAGLATCPTKLVELVEDGL
jgi:hypothetical protein